MKFFLLCNAENVFIIEIKSEVYPSANIMRKAPI